ncbi:MAG: response regulator [Anaerolineae bacterium]|nr:response regulator [Anaerolineae bacterium]
MKRILIAEDEPDILLLIKRKLTSAGYEVLAAEDGEQALDIAQSHDLDLLLLDVDLPGLTGLQVCETVKTAGGTDAPPVILLSALGQRLDVSAGQAAGADDYIIKPFSPRQLLARIESMLES